MKPVGAKALDKRDRVEGGEEADFIGHSRKELFIHSLLQLAFR